MTAQILSAELSNLIQESKKRNPELKTAAEKSLKDLKALPITSEAQVAADLSRRPSFINPFLLACNARNAKFAAMAVVCLQRLVVSRALPKERLKEVLEAFQECSSQGLDIQLKILQALPSLIQNYHEELHGELLNDAFQICCILQSSKTAVITNTAAATLQQLVVSVFDQVVAEDRNAEHVPTDREVATTDGPVAVRAAALDAFRLLEDLCLLVDDQRPHFLRASSLPQNLGIELIESVLTSHADLVRSHPEQIHVLRTQLMPFLTKVLAKSSDFPVIVRVFRVIDNVLKCHLSILVSECEGVLSLMTALLDPEKAALWKRAICMEVFRGIHAEPGLSRKIHAEYDEQDGRKPILSDHMAALARLATEKPTIIGLGKMSTTPVGSAQLKDLSSQQAAMEAGGVAGTIGAAVGVAEPNIPGISVQWSFIRIPCLDQLDKSEAPSLPDSYIYSLVLTCVNSFSEGLAKFILPLTIQNDSKTKRRQRPTVTQDLNSSSEIKDDGSAGSFQKQERLVTSPAKRDQVPINPITLTSHPRHCEIQTSAAIIETCWPAVLAITSTFLYASLDSECHHGLVRSFQKFTHVAGLLRLNTPRDAFMTTLGKAAVPVGLLTPNLASTPSTPAAEAQGIFQNARGLLSVDSLVGHATSIGTDKYLQAVDSSSHSLNIRHLLCLRALLNLGIALGPILGKAWSIVLETLQQADFVITAYSHGTGLPSSMNRQKDDSQVNEEAPESLANLSGEIVAVESAASRMFESTSGFPNNGFRDFVSALCNLIGTVDLESQVHGPKAASILPSSPRTPSQSHKRQVSGTRFPTSSIPQSEDDRFILLKLGDIADINILRLTSYSPSESGWDLICGELVTLLSSVRIDTAVRLNAAKVLNRLILSAFNYAQSQPAEAHTDVQILGLSSLRAEIQSLYAERSEESRPVPGVDTEIHQLALETLKAILEQWGGALIAGWGIVFDIISSAFHDVESVLSTAGGHDQSITLEQRPTCSTRSPELVRSSFNSLRLICSDFLSSLSTPCTLMLVDTLYRFCSQPEDFNISLTTTAFFWDVSDFIQGLNDELDLDSLIETGISLPRILETAKNEHLEVAAPALWLVLQIRLITVTVDSRLEVRNGAVQTTLRIFDAYGDKLTPSGWKLCLRTIIFKMMEANEVEYLRSKRTERREDSVKGGGLNKTAIIIVQGVGRLVAAFLDKIKLDASFSALWQDLLSHLKVYLRRESLKLYAAIYLAIHHILSGEADIKSIGNPSVELIWTLWATHNPALVPTVDGNKETNVGALTAYMESFKVLYPLIDTALTFERVERVLNNLRSCAFNADLSRYSADVGALTPLQILVLDCLKLIRRDIPGVPSLLVGFLADTVSKPFKEYSHTTDAGQPSFIALSKAAMDLIESHITRHKAHGDLLASGALTQSIDALIRPIELKYQWGTESKQRATWQKATSVATSILAETLPVLRDSSFEEEKFQEFWKSVVRLAKGITGDDCSSASLSALTLQDEEFDISAFTRLRNLIIPSLGSSLVSDTIRQSYTSSIFTNSIIHTPHRQDLPRPDQEPLENLYATHMGRTFDPPPTRRLRMSYDLVDELFSLVAVYHHHSGRHDHAVERIKLAQAAAPFLILRAAVVLKAYIADQPLRGLMPQPMSQKRELIYIVRKLVELESEPRAIPDARGVRSEYKKHLHRLFPLVTRAVGVAWRDESVLRELQRVLEVVGAGFGVG